ncbi:MAG: helix-turn-helix domain-containing protein [Campylobacterales bacterium]|nr:helix-turn-helix domain-containing protein [Campylobacterales bacterium]
MAGKSKEHRNIPFPSSAELITDGMIVKFKYKEYSHFFLGDDNQNNFIFESLLNKIEGLQNTINRGLILDTLSRVSKFIFEYKEAYKYLKQYEIASMLSITPETLSRTLKKLVEKDLIILEKGKIKIKNLEGLKKLF